ncbi:leucine Rich Repeat [Seminavis robusta]|uniref:Leucine Rich Repeat n=1 Tax=Seminavis robusta TaxID=568900 RepID=A0A9N8E476_9STRA|nr:leucine Rich Repeat [Seminavis robusta]|eukprot:Sro647_g180850.1 leucine Rich Repeat (567) ;mRNA; r:7455-9309
MQGMRQQQAVADSSSESKSESSMHDDHSNHAVELVEAEAVNDVEHHRAVAHPSMDGTHRRQAITRKYQFRFAGFVLFLLFGCGIIIGSVCGAGLCGSSDSIESTKTARDILQVPQMEIVLTTILGKDYFDGVVISGEGYHSDLTDFLRESRQKSFDWIVNQDPLQLEYDAPNLFQRFLLVLFYHQTTRHNPWKECNPPVTSQGSTSFNSCYELEYFSGETTHYIWGNKWLSVSHECQWAGVTCETGQREEQEVVELELRWNQLNGLLPWEITRLPQLKNLDLHHNMLTGVMPQRLFTNQSGLALESLSLDVNQLSGPIPARWFEETAKLTNLDSSSNRLTGRIPSELGLLPMKYLNFGNNSLTGSLPVEVFYQDSLQWLFLHINDLTGTLPTEVGLLANLEYLDLSGNSVSGSLPSEIGLASQLQNIQVSYTNMQGTLPEELYGISILRQLVLDSCNFSGTISSSVGLLTDLVQLGLSSNKFHGTIPNEINSLTNLALLRVNENELTGTVPESVCHHVYLFRGDSYHKVALEADCLPSTETGVPTIECAVDCCTLCCDNTGYCLAN